MKTEMEQLKENAQEQYAKERVAELVEHMNQAIDDMSEARKWAMRTTSLNMLNIACYWIGLMFVAIKELPETYIEQYPHWFLLIFLGLVLREHYFEKKVEYAEGKLDGIYLALETLYPQNRDKGGNARRKVKRRSLFKRFKEFFERIGERKTKEVPA